MLVHVYKDSAHFESNKLPKSLDGIEYVAPAKDSQGWVLVKEDGGEIILPMGVVIESFGGVAP